MAFKGDVASSKKSVRKETNYSKETFTCKATLLRSNYRERPYPNLSPVKGMWDTIGQSEIKPYDSPLASA
ncbi:14358_t:CDS:2 [Funneliformis mosseae]|uniref:14358_t:CDS:1 n=1 Tax=Funneliformis mosseae TaxID=27381 RepID=A0A9N9I7B6_FUNMO|nr:14358_t:CDS:2 [Funneliformis mosseae]